MKNNLIKSFYNKCIKPHLQANDWQLKGDLLYRRLANGILQGFCFDSSSFSATRFEVVALVVPLYVPKRYLGIGFGNTLPRAGKFEVWEYDPAADIQMGAELADLMNKSDADFFSKIPDPKGFYTFYKKEKKNTFHFFEAVAYSAVAAQLPDADGLLKDCLAYMKNKENLSLDLVKESYDNTNRLLNAGKEERAELLKEWEAITAGSLKI